MGQMVLSCKQWDIVKSSALDWLDEGWCLGSNCSRGTHWLAEYQKGWLSP